ncbi:MAG: M1 family metallopeptidase [Myxococcaceae bacterium]
MTTRPDDRNYRLSREVLPRRYEAHLAIDIAQKSFSGSERVTLSVARPVREFTLHALGLDVTRVEVRLGKTVRAARVSPLSLSETVLLEFEAELPTGEATLYVEWTGSFCDGLRGLYLAGDVAATQFEAADARRVFPCFDEPAFKARWALSVEVPEGLTVLSNGAETERRPTGDGRDFVRFAETELLPSYLVALVAGPLVSSPEDVADRVPVRTWALAAKAHLTHFGQTAALAALPRLQAYFGLPYAFGKLDQVAIPDFEAGAMENAGLITYRELALLVDPLTAPLSVQKRIAEVVTHELAHHWFGNWVTMVWWDDLWLNEAFATWMAYKMVDAWKPGWRVWLDFDAGKSVALHLDALRSTHPIRGTVRNAGEAGEAFDAITYEKGGAVLRMIEGFLGQEPFRAGIRAYMRKHARGNAVADDLWAALAEASSQPVLEVANAWIRQPGYPVVSVSLTGNRLSLAQARFFSDPSASGDERWPVPLVLRWEDATGEHETRTLLRDWTHTTELDVSGSVQWLCANAGSTGFYRVAYDGPALLALRNHLGALAPSERIGLLADQWALVRAGRGRIADFLDVALGFADERDDAVLDELVGKLGYVEARLVDAADAPRFRRVVEGLFGPAFARMGWEPGPEESDLDRLRRASLLRAVGGLARSPGVLAEASARVARMLEHGSDALEANLLDGAVGIAARAGDASLFEKLKAAFPGEPDPATKRRYLMALTAFEDASLAGKARGLLLDGGVPMQDVAGYVHGLLANREAREASWQLLQERWTDVLARTGGAPMLVRRVVEALGNLHTRAHLEEVRAFLARHSVPEAQQAVAQTLERLGQDVALRERLRPEVESWLKARGS